MTGPPKSRLPGVDLTAGGPDGNSFVLALRAMLRSYGATADYDDLAALTGAAFMFTCAPETPSPAWWPNYARHAFLEPSARAHGLTLRPLHPPEAAPLPRTPPEFADHFRDSYSPFVKHALQRDEPVMALLCDASGVDVLEWGIITLFDEPTSQYHVVTSRSRCPLPLESSPVQVYLVDGYSSCRPSPEQFLRTALPRAAMVLNNRLNRSLGVLTGPEAMVKWKEALSASLGMDGAAVSQVWNRSRLLGEFVNGWTTAARYLKKQHGIATAQQWSNVERLINLEAKISALIEPVAMTLKLGKPDAETAWPILLAVFDDLIDLERQAANLLPIEATNADL